MVQTKGKDIHVIMINCVSSYSLTKSLASLKCLEHRIEGITIFNDGYLNLQINSSPFNKSINYVKSIEQDVGTTLNNLIQRIACDYILFLDNNAFFTSDTLEEELSLDNTFQLLTYKKLSNAEIIETPLLVKVDFLKKNPFFKKSQLPFKEALFSSWLSKIDRRCIKNVQYDFIKQSPLKQSQCLSQRIEFANKYHYERNYYEGLPSISVMISNYNMEHYVENAINSCFLQTQLPQNIFVIDDGSTDDSFKNLEKWIGYLGFNLFKTENMGKAKAMNKLIPYINTDFVLELDADDWLDPNAFGVIRRHLKDLPQNVALLYGNWRLWKQTSANDVRYAGLRKGKPISNKQELISYPFPLGPRIYRTSILKSINGFPLIEFENGRMYEDVSIINKLLKNYELFYKDFTVYNVREHNLSITKKNHSDWSDFLKYLD
ncbi:glycosyltransferase family 2 protein [Priestia aryabhattai]|uniref:glycosyltransferase family 2 protein n=1 Tax=Priestia aryabhattai TaxID=412384 RepID=UPI003C9B2171